MTINTTKQEIAEYREQIQTLIGTVEELAGGPIVSAEVEAVLQSAYWTLDKYSKKALVVNDHGEVQWELL